MILDQLPEIQKLPSDQKRQLAEELWLSADDPNENTVDPSILELLNQRLAEHQADPESAPSWQQVRERVFRGHANLRHLYSEASCFMKRVSLQQIQGGQQIEAKQEI